MGKRWVCLLVSAGLFLSLTACGSTGGTDTSAGSQEKENGGAPKYMALVGQTEETVIADLGEGSGETGSNTAADNAVRQYTDEVYGVEAGCAVLFNENQVTMVYITYAPGEMDFQTLLQDVTEDYGEPGSKSQEDTISGDSSSTAQWEMEDGSIFIYETVDGCGMQIAS